MADTLLSDRYRNKGTGTACETGQGISAGSTACSLPAPPMRPQPRIWTQLWPAWHELNFSLSRASYKSNVT